MKFFTGAILYIVLAFSNSLFAQYQLDEVGIKLGGGLSTSLPASGTKSSFGMNINLFYGHWVCGKRWGYQIDGGFRGSYLREQAEQIPSLIYKDKVFNTLYGFYAIDLGAYLKIRSENYHQDHETQWFFGVKMNFNVATTAAHQGTPSFILKNDSYRTINPLTFGIHVSPWFRFPTKKKNNAWYLNPGLEYYPVATITNPTQATRGFYLFLNYGRTIWNNR